MPFSQTPAFIGILNARLARRVLYDEDTAWPRFRPQAIDSVDERPLLLCSTDSDRGGPDRGCLPRDVSCTPELITEGESLAEAYENGQDTLIAVFEIYEEPGRLLPQSILRHEAGQTRRGGRGVLVLAASG